jgi:hypothetical protein
MIPRPSPAATRSSPVASAILALCAVGAMGAAVTAVPRVAAADPAVQGAELWRLVGYLTFAGLFLILARRETVPVPGLEDLGRTDFRPSTNPSRCGRLSPTG